MSSIKDNDRKITDGVRYVMRLCLQSVQNAHTAAGLAG
jgi:hypothetical protein